MKRLIVALLCILGYWSSVYGWTYPVINIQGNFCGAQEPNCEIPLPKIHNADYLSYYSNPLYRRVYTVLWGGTYFGGWDFGLGAHKGVDIASSLGTPIYAIGTGQVINAQSKGDRGKVITIKHHFAGRYIYSNYAHLDEILVEPGEQVGEGQLIAKMGTSGYSTGPHIHFQIDTNEGKHPYHPSNCGGETLMQNVNEARCRNQIQKNTLDPILFLETQGKIFESEVGERLGKSSQFSHFLASDELDIQLKKQIFHLDNFGQLEIRNLRPHADGFLRGDIEVEAGEDTSLIPNKIIHLGKERTINIKAKKSGLFMVKIRYDGYLAKEIPFFVVDDQLLALLKEKAKTRPELQTILSEL